jgi:hypothetical protein
LACPRNPPHHSQLIAPKKPPLPLFSKEGLKINASDIRRMG